MLNKRLYRFLFVVTLIAFSLGTFSAATSGNLKNNNDQMTCVDAKLSHSYFYSAEKDQVGFIHSQKAGKYVPLTGNLEQMKYFLNALKNSKNQKVRVAHFGDSLIMGDVITEHLRNKFQTMYGGKGVGMLSLVADDNRMKRTVHHTYSEDWTYASIVSGDRAQYPLGMNGTVCIPKPGSWAQYEATQLFETVGSFNLVRLIYSNADKTSIIEYSFDNDKPSRINLENGNEVQQLVLNPKRKITKVKIEFISGKAPYMYGVSLESSGDGVYIDNFSLRGNSGVSLLDISSDTYARYGQFVNYNLVILNFGANVSFTARSAYILYENKIEEVIEKLKKSFPKTSFLLVGVGDKTMKKGSRYITNPDVLFLRDIQKKIVEKTGIAYWDLWDAMGGDNSMYSWVNAAPSLAYRDYLHFNPEGGEVIANLLFEAISNVVRN